MYELVPNTSIPRTEGAIIELSRAVDRVAECLNDLSKADIERLRVETMRLADVIFDAPARRAP